MTTAAQRTCTHPGCDQPLSNPKHDLCYQHWKAQRDGAAGSAAKGATAKSGGGAAMLSSTKLGAHFGLPATRMNLVLAELGWIEKYVKGWTPTKRGNEFGAEVREMRQTGVPYVVWPQAITQNRVLLASIKEQSGDGDDGGSVETTRGESTGSGGVLDGFREKFPARFRATDGHMVRSRAEVLIDNWLYMQGIVHAFERKLPIEEDVYCDFYLPAGKVYIEYWGMEKDPKYAARMKEKQAIYARYGLNLVELGDDEIMNLDDVLPRLLLKYNIDCT